MRLMLSLISLYVLLSLSACGENDAADTASPRPVKLYSVKEAGFLDTRHFIGRVDAVSTVDLSFQVGGRITDLPVSPGEMVKTGALIASLEPVDYQLAVDQAELELAQARRDLDRNRPLFDQGAVPQATMDQLRTAAELAEVALARARRDLAYTQIRAPFDAWVTRRFVDPFTNVVPNTRVVRVQNVDELRIHINAPEHLMSRVAHPDDVIATAVFSHRPDLQIPLTYREHETEPDAVAQTYRVTFGMPRETLPNVLPGMTVTVLLRPTEAVEQRHQQIPVGALDSDAEGGFRVWVYHADEERVRPQAVTLLSLLDEEHALVAGLQGNETIVSAGIHLLHDDMHVTPFTSP